MSVPKAFFSYVRHVDDHDGGRLTRLRERLEGEIRVQTGIKVEIFQDIASIKWGDRWKRELLESLTEAYFLIPIITPGYFISAACREEYELFKARQGRLGTVEAEVILPVYYVETDELSDPAWREGNDWATEVHAFQWADWRSLRLELWESPAPNRLIEKMAREFKDRLKIMGVLKAPRSAPAGPVPKPPETRVETELSEAREASAETSIERNRASAALPRRRELIVDKSGKGQFTTIGDAIRAAGTDDIILIQPGTYREGIALDKSLTLLGHGPRDAIIVEATEKNALKCTAPFGRVANITLRKIGDSKRFCVVIAAGLVELEYCDITSQSLACLVVNGGADPTIRRNRIHDGTQGGVFVLDNGRGTFEDNDIFANGLSGFEVKNGGDPVARHNRIHDGKQAGILVNTNGRGTFEDNDIFANECAGIEVTQGGAPAVRRNRIRNGKGSGVHVRDNGQGTFEDNDIIQNLHAGVTVRTGASPMVRGNRITGNAYEAIWVTEGGRGTFVNNDLRDNKRGPWDIASDCVPHINREGNIEK